jgi:hypothetical protein
MPNSPLEPTPVATARLAARRRHRAWRQRNRARGPRSSVALVIFDAEMLAAFVRWEWLPNVEVFSREQVGAAIAAGIRKEMAKENNPKLVYQRRFGPAR